MNSALNRFLENERESGAFFSFGTSRQNRCGYFFSSPEQELTCRAPGQVHDFFRRVEKYLKSGRHVAGYWTYEFGNALLGFPVAPGAGPGPLAWVGVFSKPHRVDWKPPQVPKFPASPYWLHPGVPAVTFGAYRRAFEDVQRKISAGETYQVNLTFPLETRLEGSAGALFGDLFREQPARYAAFLRGGGKTVLSFSPELFFAREENRILTRPMKGTLARFDASGNVNSPDRLRDSKKNQAENLMIVDLLRNDLGRICQTGSVSVPSLFRVETLPSLYQMTSTVAGRLRQPLAWKDIFTALFPSGSVTGAPKIQTMKIIAQAEKRRRGVYTGALGWIAPNGDAKFNLPIRTLEVDAGYRHACMGIGSGVVSDSKVRSEWNECLAKASFMTQSGLMRDYALLETLLWEPGKGFRHWELHRKRLAASARFFGVPLDFEKITKALFRQIAPAAAALRVRLMVSAEGRTKIESTPWADDPAGSLRMAAFSRQKVNSRNIFLRHKTTNREGYDREGGAAREKGLADVLFCNEQGAVTEGAITNVFIRKGRMWLTPPVRDGLLPGVERAYWIQKNGTLVREKTLYRRDLISADEIFLCNSVRGMFPVKLSGFFRS